MTCIAVTDNYLAISKGLHIDCYDQYNSTHGFFNIPTKPGAEENDHISHLTISSDSKYLATLTSSSKQLTICSLPLSEDIITLIVPRSASKIRFTANNSQILVADKSGDVLLYSVKTEEPGTKLLGHLSLLLDVLQTPDEKFIITSDRDEKIRVSRYPNTYNIHTYCLGHKEYVNIIEMLPHNDKYLTSSSGDGTVKIWDYIKGTLVYNVNASLDIDNLKLKEDFVKIMDDEGIEVNTLPVVHYTATLLNEDCSLLAVGIHSYNKLLIYSLQSKEGHFTHKKEEIVELEQFPTAIMFHKQSLFLFNEVNTTVTVMKIVTSNNKIGLEFDKKIKMFDTKAVDFNIPSSLEGIKILYKRKFDNVQEYQERKRQRLEKSS